MFCCRDDESVCMGKDTANDISIRTSHTDDNELTVNNALSGLYHRHILSVLYQGGHKPGILRDFSEHGKLREFCGILWNSVRHSNISVKQLLTG